MPRITAIKISVLAKCAVLTALTLGLHHSASAGLVFDAFDEHGHTTTSTSASAGDISTITSLGVPVGDGIREIVASSATATVDTSSGGTFTGVGNYTQFRYGSWTTAGAPLNLDLSGHWGFEFDVLSVSGSTTPEYSLQFLANGTQFYTPATSIPSSGTYNLRWSAFNGSGVAPTSSDLMDIDAIIMINNYNAGSGTLQFGELRLVPEPSSSVLMIGAFAVLGLLRRRSK